MNKNSSKMFFNTMSENEELVDVPEASIQERIHVVRQELERVYQSKSWRLTRPFRAIRRAIAGSEKLQISSGNSWQKELTATRYDKEAQQLGGQDLLNAQAELNAVYNSSSWVLTQPLRALIRILWHGKNHLYLLARLLRNHMVQALSVFANSLRQLLYVVARSNVVPPWIKYRILEYGTKFVAHIFQPHSNESNRKMMKSLAKERQASLYKASPPCADAVLPDIEISVVTHNSRDWVQGFFKSLCEQNYPLEKITLHFVDNDSNDGTLNLVNSLAESVSGRFKSVNVYSRPNLGFGAGHDFAIKNCVSAYVLVSNIDLEFEKDAIERVVAFAEADKSNTASWELRQKPYEHPKYYDPVTMEVAWSSHACVLLRRSAYEAVGGYEKRIFMYGEDVELSYRFRDFGYSVKYVPHSVVWHHTYKHAHEVKPLQFTGSTLANAYIRLRYGTVKDIVAIPMLYMALLARPSEIENSKKLILKNALKIMANAVYFLSTRKKSELSFPFRAWDYEMQKDGAFLELKPMSQELPLVSVITRTYSGREKWLREAIASVMNQTYPNIEMVIVEDGGDSQEELVDRLKEYLPSGKRIVFSGQPKKGRSFNGNAGLSLATGKYCVFLDDDDLFFPDHIETLVGEILSSPECNGVYSLSWEVETSTFGSGVDPHYEEMSHTTPQIFRQEFSQDVIKHHNFLPIQAVLFKSHLFDKFGGFAVEMDALEDWDLWVRYSSDGPFKYVEKTTSLFRTPHEIDERARRHQVLHDSYAYAKKRQKMFFGAKDPMPESVF